MKKLLITIILPLALISTSCYHFTGNSGVPGGTIIMVEGENGFSANAYTPASSKGEACVSSYSILTMPLIVTGDASIQLAAENGQITRIDSVSHKIVNESLLFAWKLKYCTVVRGEKLRKELLEQR